MFTTIFYQHLNFVKVLQNSAKATGISIKYWIRTNDFQRRNRQVFLQRTFHQCSSRRSLRLKNHQSLRDTTNHERHRLTSCMRNYPVELKMIWTSSRPRSNRSSECSKLMRLWKHSVWNSRDRNRSRRVFKSNCEPLLLRQRIKHLTRKEILQNPL